MIRFEKFFKTLHEKGISQVELYTKYKVSRNTLQRLKDNKNITTNTLNYLCNIIGCELEDILEYKKDEH